MAVEPAYHCFVKNRFLGPHNQASLALLSNKNLQENEVLTPAVFTVNE